jgi:hypothetical protein
MNTSRTVEQAHQELKNACLAFIRGRPWDSVTCHAVILNKMARISIYLVHQNQIERKRLAWTGASTAPEDAVLFLRDDLLNSTGERMWGLTFTLYPDGNFNIEFDCKQPKGHEAALTQADALSVEERLPHAWDRMAAALSSHQSFEEQWLATAMGWLEKQTAKHRQQWGLGSETQWHLDMNEGRVRWSFADGRVMQAPAQVVGTYCPKERRFTWGWEHPSVPEALQRAALQVRALGFDRWVTRVVDCSHDEAWQFAAVAAQHDGAAGAYRGDSEGTWMYLSFDEPRAVTG